MKLTKPTTKKEIKRGWHLVDVKDQVLGRVAPKIANLLMGKSKPYYARNLDCGDFVVVVNAFQVKATGKKETQKKYRKHSGYPGGFKELTLSEMRAKNPCIVLQHAVSHMVPDNKLKKKLMARLYVFIDDKHSYKDKFQS